METNNTTGLKVQISRWEKPTMWAAPAVYRVVDNLGACSCLLFTKEDHKYVGVECDYGPFAGVSAFQNFYPIS